jgi:hypothetical protein
MQPNPRSLSKVVALLVCLPALAQAAERLRVEPGTKIPVRLERSVGTKDFYEWHSFGGVRTVTGTLMQDIATSDGQVALPAGTKISIAVLESKRAGRIEGRSQLRLGLYSVLTPDGERIPLDGYANQLTRHKKTDKEGTAHGNRGLVKDAGVDFSAVAIGAGAGFVAAGPVGGALGAGGGLLVAAIWTVARRGPDIVVPAGTVIDFVLDRPASFMAAGDYDEEQGAAMNPQSWGAPAPVNPPRWGANPSTYAPQWRATSPAYVPRWSTTRSVSPSDDLLELSDQLNSDPAGVLRELKGMNLKDRPPVDRTFAKYLRALAKFQTGDHSSEPLNLMRDAYTDAQRTAMAPAARAEMARNLIVIMRATEKDWQRDPLLNDAGVQAALVEEIQ